MHSYLLIEEDKNSAVEQVVGLVKFTNNIKDKKIIRNEFLQIYSVFWLKKHSFEKDLIQLGKKKRESE